MFRALSDFELLGKLIFSPPQNGSDHTSANDDDGNTLPRVPRITEAIIDIRVETTDKHDRAEMSDVSVNLINGKGIAAY